MGVRIPQESQHTCQWCNGSIKISKIFGGGSSPSWCAKYQSGVKVAALVLETNVLGTCGFDSHLWYTFLGSSAVEHSAVNRTVPGSNPVQGVFWPVSRVVKMPPFHGGDQGFDPPTGYFVCIIIS